MKDKYFIPKRIALLGIGIALYVVLGFMVKIPLIAHIQTDLGYLVFGVMCAMVGWPAFIVGVLGALIESLIFSGWVPIGWMVGQALIGIICGLAFKHIKIKWVNIIIAIAAVFLGVAVCKTGIECALYDIPLLVKFPKNAIAFIADAVPMVMGYVLAITALKKPIALFNQE